MKNLTKTLLVALVSFLCSATANAYFEVDGIYYNILSMDDLTVEVTRGDDKYTGDVVIPSTVTYKSRTLSVTGIGEDAFHSCSTLTSIEIGNSVTSIGYRAFYGCSSLTSIVIPNSVTSIGDYAFYECSSLASIEIGDSVTSIGNAAFHSCCSLTSVEIPNGVTSIGDFTFSCCSSLTSVKIGNSVASIGEKAFYDCSNLTSIYMQGATPPSVRSDNFTNKQYQDVILYVPNGSLAAYQSTDIWKNFLEIKEYADTGEMMKK